MFLQPLIIVYNPFLAENFPTRLAEEKVATV